MIEQDYIKEGNCLELMKELPAACIDMVLCDPPYGVTACEWDRIIPFESLWQEYRRIVKRNGAIVLFAKEPFTSQLIMSNERGYKHKWIWNKKLSGSFQLAKYMPLQIAEDIVVFTQKGERVNYYPQMRKGLMRKRGGAAKTNSSMGKGFILGYSNVSDEYYPTNIVECIAERKDRLHPTQKPVELLEYLIRSYSQESELVLDNCIGSGSTAIACIRTGRHYIGYELCENYFRIAQERIEKYRAEWGGIQDA